MMRGRLRYCKGQSILEYLIILALVIGALSFVRNDINTAIRNIFSNSQQTLTNTANTMGTTLPTEGTPTP